MSADVSAAGVPAESLVLPPIAQDPASVNRRYPCLFDGCNKTFQRKEHLGRHERTHNPQTLCICEVCHRKFNRSDSLIRHLARHGDAFKPNPSGRSKIACVSCHSGKTKCDGTQPCSTCRKKNANCVYRQDHGDQATESSSSHGQAGSPAFSDRMLAFQESSTTGAPESSTTGPEISITSPDPPRSNSSHDRLPSVTAILGLQGRELETSMISMPPPRFGYIDWMSVRIQSDPKPENATSSDSVSVDPFERRYLDSFFENFHHRWGLIHRPSFEEVNNDTPLIAAIKMIGAWCYGTPDSQDHAITVHERLINNLLPRLSGFDSSKGLCLGMCETALLNIIFAMYYGNDRAISRVYMVRNLLVAILRDVDFFKSETAWADEKAGYFLPLRLVKMGQRQRLAANLFKVDTYLSLLRCQPRTLMPEDLYFTLPPTYSIWNADGLHIWEQRHALQPAHRSQKSILEMINDSASDAPITDYPMLIEDLQLCICAMQSSVWKLYQPTGTAKSCEVDGVLQKDALRRQLNALKSRLSQIQNQNAGNYEFGEEPYLQLRHYFGYEEGVIRRWKEVVKARVKSLHFDATMLSHLMSLHLHADVKMLSHLAKCQSLTQIQELSERHRSAHEQRQISIRSWADSSMGRQALNICVDILVLHRNTSRERIPGLEGHNMDPIVHIATSVAALVLWGYCTYSRYSCVNCTPDLLPGTLFDGMHVIELTNWCNHNDQQQQAIRQLWTELGGGTRIQIQGMPICPCNVAFLVAPFQDCLPERWKVADTIAVSIFKH